MWCDPTLSNHEAWAQNDPSLPKKYDVTPRLLRQAFVPKWSSKAERCIYWPHTP